MTHPLENVYFTERCNACGKTYPVSLYTIFREQQLAEQWQSVRPSDECADHQQRLVATVPPAELAAVMEAWERLAAALEEHKLTFNVTAPEVASGPAR